MTTGEFISRKALLEKLSNGTIITDDLYGMGIMTGVGHAQDVVKGFAAADVAEVIYGQWEVSCSGKVCSCSVCKTDYDHTYDWCTDWNYCPHCGAMMRVCNENV